MIDFDNVKVLEREPDWFRRGIKEAINIQINTSALNQDWCRHTLSPVYQFILPPHHNSLPKGPLEVNKDTS